MAKRKLDLTPEERQARSDRAKALVKEGKIGGPRPGSGRPRKKRASEFVAEAARAHAKEIVEAYVDSISPTAPPAIRLQAANDWLKVEQTEAEIQMKEDRNFDNMSERELKELVMQRLLKIKQPGHEVEEPTVIEAEEVIEIEEGEEEEVELGEYVKEPEQVHKSPFDR